MAEGLVKDNKNTTFQFAFRWGSIIGLVTLIYFLVGFYTGLERRLYFGDFYFFVEIGLISWMFVAYKKENELDRLKFSKMMLLGCYAALFIALFYAMYFFVKIMKLDPLFFQSILGQIVDMMENSLSVDYFKDMTPQMMVVAKVSFLISTYISSFFNTMVYTLLLALFVTINQRIYARR